MAPPSSFTVRPATPADVPTLADFNTRIAKETEDLDLDPGVIHAGCEAAVVGGKALYFIASPSDAPDTPAACCMVTLEWSDWTNAEIWWFQSVYTHPSFRNQGAFRALFAEVESAAKAAGASGLRLYADHRNERAHEVYRKLGMSDDHYRVFEKMF